MQNKTLWYFIHEFPEASRGGKAILEVPRNHHNIQFVEMYKEYPDFKINIEREQQRLVEHELIVFQHPFYWYSVPALFKAWQDKVLAYGFAYPPKEGTALHGKGWLSVITTGGPEWSYKSGGYNNFTMSELLRPLQQTAYLCGMKWLSPYIIHSVLPSDYGPIKALSDSELQVHVKNLSDYIASIHLRHAHSLEPVNTLHGLKGLGLIS